MIYYPTGGESRLPSGWTSIPNTATNGWTAISGSTYQYQFYNSALSNWNINGATLDDLSNYVVAYWKLENLNDSKNSHTLTNTGTTTFTPGKNNNAGTFNGSSQKLTSDSSADFNLYGVDWTISAWVYANSSTANQRCIIFDGDSNKTTGFYYSSSSFLTCGDFGINDMSSYAPITTGSWQHYCATHIGTSTTIYVNGLIGAYNANYTPFTNRNFVVNIGGTSANSWGGAYFPGQIDEVMIAKGKGATPAQVVALFNNSVGAFWN